MAEDLFIGGPRNQPPIIRLDRKNTLIPLIAKIIDAYLQLS